MPLEVLLDLIRKKFSTSEGKAIVSSLQQDPLLWQFAQDVEKSLPYFQDSSTELKSFRPGIIASWLIKKDQNDPEESLTEIGTPLSEELRIRASQAFETVLNTGLPPADLLTAGLVALALREKRIQNGSWQGISRETFINSRQQNTQKLFEIWRTPFACLFSLCTDFDDITADLFQSDRENKLLASVPVIVHAHLANSIEEQELVDRLYGIFVNRTIDLQLEGLKWLESFKRKNLRKTLAKNLLETKKNIDYFASVFSDFEAFKTASKEYDPLEKKIRYSLPEDLNRLGAFYYYNGNPEKSAEAYQKASDLLNFLESQASFQAIKSQSQVSPSSWMGLVNAIPNSNAVKQYYIQTLIDLGKLDEAEDKIDLLSDSLEKQILAYQIEQSRNPKNFSSLDSVKKLEVKNFKKSPSSTTYYVHQAKFDEIDKLLDGIKSQQDVQASLKIVDGILKENFHDLEVVKKLRDIYEKAENYDKALDLTSYIERREPDLVQHKRALARLYSKKNRWEETFVTLQEFIKSTATPDVQDLEIFAESALQTGRTDIAISACQNILKKEAHNSKALILLGNSFMYKGDIIKAIQHMEQVVEMIPDEPDTWLTLAHLWKENGQTDRAFEILKKGVMTLPNEPKLLRRLGKAHLNQKSLNEALSYLQKANDIDPDNLEGKLDLAEAHYQIGQYQSAWEILEPFEETYRQYPNVAKLMGHLLLSMERKSAAEPILLFSADHFPEDVSTVIIAARLILDKHETGFEELPQEDLEVVEGILGKASDLNPSNNTLKLHLADVKRLKGDYQSALDSYKELSTKMNAEKSSENWRLDYGLGMTAIALGEFEMGLAALQDAGSSQPENLSILHGLVEGYQTANLSTKADELAQAALKLAPQNLSNILWYANYKNNHNEPEEAIKALKDALQINQDQPKIKLWLAKIYISTGAHEEAKIILTDLIAGSDIQPNDLHQAAYACVRMNELPLAVSALEKAVQEETTNNPLYLLDLASAYQLIEQPKKALELLNIEQECLKNYPQISLLRSDILSSLGQYQLAFNTLNTIKEDAEDKLDEDSEISTKKSASPLLYTNDFTFSGYLFRLGQLHRVLGNFDLAKLNLSKALSYSPDDHEIKCASFDSTIQSLSFEETNQLVSIDTNIEFEKGALSVDYLDHICSQIEWLISQGITDDAKKVINQLSPANRTYPRYLAIQSRLSAINGDFETAENYLEEAKEIYQNTLSDLQSKDLQILFRKLRNLISIAEASKEQDNKMEALHIHESAWRILDNQPYYNWLFAQTLINAAEDQQKARALSILNHAPGEMILSENYKNISQLLLENLERHLSNNDFICCKARMKAAFSGEWPLSLSADFCVGSPERAISVLISTQDEKTVNNILETYSDNPQILQAYGIYALKNNKRNAEKYVAKALEFDTSNPVNHALLAMLQKDQPQQALKSIQTALEFWPEEPQWHTFAADLYQKIGQHDMAKQHISQALEAQPDNPDLWQKSAEINLQINNLSYAKQDLERSASLKSDDTDIWIKMADVNRRLGYVHEASENIHTASKLNPDDNNIVIKEAQFLFETNQYAQAEEITDEIIKNQSNNTKAYILLAKSQAKQGKFSQAIETLSKASQKSPENHEILLETLKIRKDQEGAESVLPELVKLAQDQPDNPAILTTLTDWLIQTNRLKKAEETAQTILKIMPGQAEVHLMLGRLQRKNGQLDQAISHFSDAITIDPTMIDAYIEMGKTYQDRRELEKAIQIYHKGSQADASDPRPYYFAGMALKECKDFAGAEAMLKQAKKYAPHDSNIVRQLGMVTALNLINNLREAS